MQITVNDIILNTIDYRGKTPPTSNFGIPIISAANVKRGRVIHNGEKFVSKEVYDKWTTRGFIKAGDILITTEAPVGEVAPVPSDQTYLITRRVIALQIDPSKANQKYLLYFLLTDSCRKAFEIIAHGSTVPRLYKDEILNLKINLPPLPTQHRIANILSAYDDLIENNNQRINILAEMAQQLYKEWFVRMRFPGWRETKMVKGVPEGWQVMELSQLIEIKNGKSAKIDSDGTYKVYGSNGQIGKSKNFNAEDSIIIGRVGAYCGSIIYESKTFWATDNTIVAKSKSARLCNIAAFFLLKALNLRNLATGSAQPLLTQNLIGQIKVTVPTEKLNEKFKKIQFPIFLQIELLTQKNTLLRQTRDLLLPRLISGQLRVGEAEK